MADEKKTKQAGADKPKNLTATAKKMLSLLMKKKGQVIFVFFITVVCTILTNIGPVYLGDIIDNITELVKVKLTGQPLDFTEIKKIIFTILAIYVSSSVMTFFQHYVMAGINRNLIFNMRSELSKKLSVLPLKYFDSNSKGDILSRVTNDVDNIQNTFQANLIQVITSVVSVIGVFVIMMIISPVMTAVSVVALPFGLVAALIILRKSRVYFRANWKTMGALNGHIEEMFTGHNIVKVFNHTKKSCDDFRKINDELAEIDCKAQFLSGILMPIITLTSNLGYVLICIVGGILVVKGDMTVGEMTVFFVYSKLFMQPIVDLSNITNNLQSSLASAERVFDVIDRDSEVADNNSFHITTGADSVITFENVDFAYLEDKPLIENLNITVNPGQLVALVGPTGAGKTTIVNLLMRFYDVNSGAIKIDGIDIRDIPRKELRNVFGMVLQDTWLFEGTVKANIAYARPDATDEEIISAAKAANADEFIQMLPDEYDTVLEEGAANISQGQRQLLTIARAILANPDIIILDEATSSVDTRTEVKLQFAMNELMKNRTNFVIAHRLSTIRNADMILVMNEGRIVETGTHQALLDKNGFYKELYEAQFSGSTI